MFGNVAPVMPDVVLSALENAFADADEATLDKGRHFVRLLRSVAYDPEHFARAVSLLVKFARRQSGDDRTDEDAANVVASLFYIVLSGTHAPLETRLKVVEGLLRSSDAAEQGLGVKALEAMLKTSHFSSTYSFEFGVRSRDYGYHPPTGQDVRDWFVAALKLAEPFALSEAPVVEGVRKAIASEFHGLWRNVNLADELERIARGIAAKGFWRDGWIAARQTRIYDGDGLPPELPQRLKILEEFLRPKDLVDKVRGVVLQGASLDLDDLDEVQDGDYAAAATRAAATIEALGRDVVADDDAFKKLLPELTEGEGRTVAFGRGIAAGAEKPHETWRVMVAQLAATKNANVGLLCGFLEGLQSRDDTLVDALLDEALEDRTLAEWLPVLQGFVVIDEKGLTRLHRALDLGKAPINRFLVLAGGRTCDVIPGHQFKALLLAIGQKSGGIPVAMEILSMRLHSDRSDKKKSVPEVAEAGRELLAKYQFHRQNQRAAHEDYRLGVIVRASLAGEGGKSIVRRLCRDFLAAAARYDVHAFEYDDLMKALFQVHPADVLDELVAGSKKGQSNSIRIMYDLERFGRSPIAVVPDDIILHWCDCDPKVRCPFMAAIGQLFDKSNDGTPHKWTALTRKLLLKAPDKEAVFSEIINRLHPTSWSGSRATMLELHLRLLDELDVTDLPALACPLDRAKGILKSGVDAERRRETERDLARSGRFE
jgi:hypothetical protein